MTKVAVVGNTRNNIGAASAADLTLAGHEVTYSVFPEQAKQLEPLRRRGGLELEGDINQLVSRRNGLARLNVMTSDPSSALAGADVVLLDIQTQELETRFCQLLPYLPEGIVVHVQSHGYWPASRLSPLARTSGRDDIVVTEAAAPTVAASLSDGVVGAKCLRRRIAVAARPTTRLEPALARLRTLYPYLLSAPSVIQCGLENINLMVHPAMVLLGVGLFDQAEKNAELISFYRTCNLPHAGVLAEALDAERARICAAYGIRHHPVWAAIDDYYGTDGKVTYTEAVSASPFYQALSPMAPGKWRDWELDDVPYAIVPVVRLAEQAGVACPLHRAISEVLGTLLGIDPWSSGPTLAQMDLLGSPAEVTERVQSER